VHEWIEIAPGGEDRSVSRDRLGRRLARNAHGSNRHDSSGEHANDPDHSNYVNPGAAVRSSLLPMRTTTRSLAFACLAVVGSCGCGGGGSSLSPTAATPTTATPTAQTPPRTTNAEGRDTTPPVFSVTFVPTDAVIAFFIFGATLPSGVQNPTFEIETANQTTPVFAVSAGRVVNIANTSQGDRAVFVQPNDTSVFDIAYDHVSNVQVSVGQTVTAGQQIGTVGTLNNGRGRTELQINRTEGAASLAQCITNFGTTAFNEAFRAVALRVNGSATVCAAETVRP
jgi:biotin carboxyl carrier protein